MKTDKKFNNNKKKGWRPSFIPDPAQVVRKVRLSVPPTAPNNRVTNGTESIPAGPTLLKRGPRLSARQQDILLGPPGLLIFGVLISLLAACITVLGSW